MRKRSEIARPQAKPEHGRNANRYDIGLSLRYIVRRRGRPSIPGVGRSINLSSSGMLFSAEGKLVPGDSIIAALEWPARMQNGTALYLLVTGYVVRSKSQLVAISISRNELIPAQELTQSFETFVRRLGTPRRRQPILTPIVLIDEDEAACSVIAAIVNPHGWRIERAGPVAARRILDAGFPPVSLLVTRSPEILEDLDAEIPIILTVTEAAAPPPQISRLPLLAVVSKPLIYGDLRAVIRRLCEKQSPFQTTGTSA